MNILHWLRSLPLRPQKPQPFTPEQEAWIKQIAQETFRSCVDQWTTERANALRELRGEGNAMAAFLREQGIDYHALLVAFGSSSIDFAGMAAHAIEFLKRYKAEQAAKQERARTDRLVDILCDGYGMTRDELAHKFLLDSQQPR